jgi:hypothetical protein
VTGAGEVGALSGGVVSGGGHGASEDQAQPLHRVVLFRVDGGEDDIGSKRG